MTLPDCVERTSDGFSVTADVVLKGNLKVRQLCIATLCHDLSGVELPSLGVDGGVAPESPFGEAVDVERDFDDFDAKGFQLIDLTTGARVPSFDSLLLLVGAQRNEVLKVFRGRPEHTDGRFLHGEILSVVVRTNTVAGRGEAASLSPEGQPA